MIRKARIASILLLAALVLSACAPLTAPPPEYIDIVVEFPPETCAIELLVSPAQNPEIDRSSPNEALLGALSGTSAALLRAYEHEGFVSYRTYYPDANAEQLPGDETVVGTTLPARQAIFARGHFEKLLLFRILVIDEASGQTRVSEPIALERPVHRVSFNLSTGKVQKQSYDAAFAFAGFLMTLLGFLPFILVIGLVILLVWLIIRRKKAPPAPKIRKKRTGRRPEDYL